MKRVRIAAFALAMLLTASIMASCGLSPSKPAASPAPAAGSGERTITVAANRFAQHVDWPEMYVWQVFEEETGIKVNWEYIEGVAIQEQRNLRVATGDLPDAFYGGRWAAGEIAQYTAEGVFVPIEGYLNSTYAPNTTRFYEQYPEIKQALYLYDGHIYGFPIITIKKFAANAIMLREAWMDEYKLDVPTTPDELFDVLMAMKNANPDALIYTDYSGMTAYAGLRNVFVGSWGLSNRGMANDNWDADPADAKKVRYIPTDDRYREMLKYINKLYENGLVDPDSMTQDEVVWGAKAAEDDPITIGFVTNDVLEEYNIEHLYIGAPCLKGPYGDQIFSAVNNRVGRPWNFIITKACKDIPTAIAFGDYWMCEEKSELFFSGKEGLHFNWNEDRTRRVEADWITKDPQGRSRDQMRATWTSQPGGSYFGISYPSVPDLTENYTRAVEGLAPYLPKIVWPAFSLTLEETAVTTAEGEDVRTHFVESTSAFISGRMSLDNDWDSYVKKFSDMGLAKIEKVYQDAYDRYLASGGAAQ